MPLRLTFLFRSFASAAAASLCPAALLALLAGCATIGTRQPLDITQPGWTVRQGQATWTPGPAQPAITGELMLATGPAKALFVQFSKPPFILVTGQAADGQWRIEHPLQRKIFTGRGARPLDRLWFALPDALRRPGAPPPGWKAEHKPDGGWSVANRNTGERLDGFLNP